MFCDEPRDLLCDIELSKVGGGGLFLPCLKCRGAKPGTDLEFCQGRPSLVGFQDRKFYSPLLTQVVYVPLCVSVYAGIQAVFMGYIAQREWL